MLINKRIPIGYILNNVKWNILLVLFISLTVNYLSHKYKASIPLMPLTIPAFIGTAISILVSFKLSQSYDRWWEARKIWGNIVNDSRSFIIQLQSLVLSGNDEQIKKIAYRQIAWCYSLGQSLRGLDAIKNIDKFLTQIELDTIKNVSNKPLTLLQLHAMDLRDLNAKKTYLINP